MSQVNPIKQAFEKLYNSKQINEAIAKSRTEDVKVNKCDCWSCTVATGLKYSGFVSSYDKLEYDYVRNPSHYAGKIETINFIEDKLTSEEFAGYLKGNSLKYLSRAGKKGDEIEDLEKCAEYLSWLINLKKNGKFRG
jgi:hypothetical protein